MGEVLNEVHRFCSRIRILTNAVPTKIELQHGAFDALLGELGEAGARAKKTEGFGFQFVTIEHDGGPVVVIPAPKPWLATGSPSGGEGEKP